MGNPDLSLKSGFRFGNQTRNAKRISPSPPEKSFTKSWLYGCPLYRCSWKSVDNVFFFSACYACACETPVLSKTVHIFSRIPDLRTPPPRPLPEKKCKLKIQKIQKKEERKTNDRLICVEIRFKISCRSIPISKIQVQISQSNTPSLLSLEVSGEFSWQWLLLSLYTLTNFLC